MIYSKQREIILDTLTELHGRHPSANEIYAHLHDAYPSLSLGTVYRNLGQLESANVISRVTVPDGADRYDDITDGHLHMICTQCGQICDIPADALDGLLDRASLLSGYEINQCTILFFGACDACKKRNNILKSTQIS